MNKIPVKKTKTKKTEALTKRNLKRKLDLIRAQIAVAYKDNQQVLLKRALYKTSDSEMSQDLVQTTFLKTLAYLKKGGKIDLMRGFLNHVLKDLIVDEYRSRNNKSVSLDILLENGFEPGSSDFERYVNSFDGKGIVLLIPELPKKYETVIRLRYLKGLSLKEIAHITDQSPSTVAVQSHRGLIKLKNLYEEKHSQYVFTSQ